MCGEASFKRGMCFYLRLADDITDYTFVVCIHTYLQMYVKVCVYVCFFVFYLIVIYEVKLR